MSRYNKWEARSHSVYLSVMPALATFSDGSETPDSPESLKVLLERSIQPQLAMGLEQKRREDAAAVKKAIIAREGKVQGKVGKN